VLEQFPDGFLWGVASAGHQNEGGNVDSDTWFAEHVRPTVFREPSGRACNGWELWRDDVDLAAGLNLNSCRFSVEWARVEPRRGVVDIAALARYRVVAQRARAAGLATSVVLVDAAWPAWLGQEAWLLPWVEPRVIEHARRVVDVLGDAIDSVVVFADAPGVIARGSR